VSLTKVGERTKIDPPTLPLSDPLFRAFGNKTRIESKEKERRYPKKTGEQYQRGIIKNYKLRHINKNNNNGREVLTWEKGQ